MADIGAGKWKKKIIRMIVNHGYKYLGTDKEVISEDLEYCPNPVFSVMNKIITNATSKLKAPHQKRIIETYAQFGLWVLYKDTGYRDPAIYIIWKLLKNADKLLPIIENQVKSPEEWYANLWVNSKEESKRLRTEGKIPNFGKSPQEALFTPSIQRKIRKKMLEK